MPLSVRSSGPPDAPTIVCLHGGGSSGWVWGPVATRLASSYHCLVLDLPEHGRSIAVGPLPDGLMRIVRENLTYRPPSLDTVTTPTLVVIGQHEPPVLRQSAFQLAAALPRANGRIVPGVAHSWNLEAPDRFAEGVRARIEARPLDGLLPLA